MPRQTLKTASLVVITAALIGKFAGFLREVIVARAFGTGTELDAFLAAISVPAGVYTILLYALPNLLVPVYARPEDDPGGPKTNFWLALFGSTAVLTLICTVFAGTVISIIVPGLTEQVATRAAGMLRAYSTIIILGTALAVGTARLQGQRYFIRPALSPVILNVVVIGGVLLFAGTYGAYSIVWSTLAATLIMVIWLWWPTGAKTDTQKSGVRNGGLAEPLGKIALGIIAVAVLGQMFFIVDRWWASFLLPGSISALNYAMTVANLPVFIVGTGLAVAIYPFLNEALHKPASGEAPLILDRAVRYLLWAAVPMAVIIGVYGSPLIGLFLERGKFSSESTALTVRLLPFLAAGIVVYAGNAIWDKVYYSRRWLARLFLIMTVAFFCKFALSWVFIRPLEIEGLALATGLSYWCWGGLLFMLI